MSKPSIPKGTRDFGPVEMARRNYIFDTIRSVFKKYGYLPIETPAMEKLETLTGKYGEEGDRLIFKILNSGEFLKTTGIRKNSVVDLAENGFSRMDLVVGEKYPLGFLMSEKEILPHITEKALRYDLTVPFARFVVQHQNDITFPFKRYQIQPVWRADRPQKGRYREFYQCDVDVIGSDSLLNEVELVQLIDEVFGKLGLTVTLKLNNRKILQGVAEAIGAADQFMDMTIAIDKLDKIGKEKVEEEMRDHGIGGEAIKKLQPLFEAQNNLDALKPLLLDSEIGTKGIEELEYVFSTINSELSTVQLIFDPTLARGLNYYTGAIFECVTEGFNGSILGGGRYDDLTGIFGLKDVSGVGVSFGADRIYDVLLDNNLYPESASIGTQVMFVNFGDSEASYCLGVLKQLRGHGIAAELYPDNAKMARQMKYANDKHVPYVVLVGEREMETGQLTVKNMETGDQVEMSIQALIEEVG